MAGDKGVFPLRVEESEAKDSCGNLPSKTPKARTIPRHIRFNSLDSEDELQKRDNDPRTKQTEGSENMNITHPRLADIMDGHYMVDFM